VKPPNEEETIKVEQTNASALDVASKYLFWAIVANKVDWEQMPEKHLLKKCHKKFHHICTLMKYKGMLD
jgi:hypothetical protein